MSTATKTQHRQTPTQRLQARITELEATLANTPAVAQIEQAQAEAKRLDATVQDLTRHLSTVTEHTFLIGDGPARILARRNDLTDQWAVIDGTLMAARYWSRSNGWQRTGGTAADMFPWSEAEARRYAEILAGSLVPPLAPQDEALADAHLAEVAGQLDAMLTVAIPTEEVEARLAETIAIVTARHARPTTQAEAVTAQPEADLGDEADPEATLTIPAPADRPDYQPEPPDVPQPDVLLSVKAQGIPANCADKTVALDVSRVHGPQDTQQMPVVHVDTIPPKADLPPLPEHPPLFMSLPPVTWRGGKVRPLSESHPVQFVKAGATT